MSNGSPEESDNPRATGRFERPPQNGVSPAATGGAGVTFERKVAVQYLAHLLTGNAAPELGDGRRVTSVAFQQAPEHAVDDLVVHAVHPDGLKPPLVLALSVRRSPKIVQSDESSQELFLQFVRAVIEEPSDETEYRFGLVVSGRSKQATQLAQLANIAIGHKDALGFFRLIKTPGKYSSGIRQRLEHVAMLVDGSLRHIGPSEHDTSAVQERTWQLLSRLEVIMPLLELPGATDWAAIANGLKGVARDPDNEATSSLRDHLLVLAGEYASKAARVDLAILRRDSHAFLDAATTLHRPGWQTLMRIDRFAREAVRNEITGHDGSRAMRLERNDVAETLVNMVSEAEAVIVSGDSGVGKSALAVIGLTARADAEKERLQAACINLRHIPELPLEFEKTLGHPLSTILCEMSAPQRLLVIDGADAATENKYEALRYLIGAARDSGIRVVAVTSIENKQVVLDALHERFDANDVNDCVVPPLSDAEIDEVVETFSDLRRISTNPRSRELLRRLVVVQLLVRGRVSGTPLTDADAMNEVWSGLVRRRGMSDRGSPDARETVLLRLADLDLGRGERLDVLSSLDSIAMDGLRRDGLLRDAVGDPTRIGPDFGHDEVRRYAVARLLLASGEPGSRLLSAEAPRWSLSAARLACQARLALPDTSAVPLKGRLAAAQASFDRLVAAGHGSRWGDVPGEALLTLVDPSPVLRDAQPTLLADDAYGLRRLVRLVDQRHRDENGVVDITVVEPLVRLLLEAPAPWRSGAYAETLLRAWLRAEVIANSAKDNPLRILLRQRLIEASDEADRHLAAQREAQTGESQGANSARASVRRELVGLGRRTRRQPSELPSEIKSPLFLELLALLGPDLGEEGEAILRRVAHDAPAWLGPAVDEFFTGEALASAAGGLLAELTEAYYLDDEPGGHRLMDNGVRHHHPKGLGVPPAGRHRGPFLALFRADFRSGVAVLNRLLNHAARIRVGVLADLDKPNPIGTELVGRCESELSVDGQAKSYLGDDHVWRWYRGNAVGPYPCVSALQALEAESDRLIQSGISIATLIPILLDGCENLAMVGLIVGLLVRHLEDSGDLLDAYIAEPTIWLHEFARAAEESSPLTANSDHVASADRRNWTLQNAAMLLVLRADSDRAEELRGLGETLVGNARRLVESAPRAHAEAGPPAEMTQDALVVEARAWASSLDRDSFSVERTQDGFTVEANPPDDVVQELQESSEDLERSQDTIRLFVRYHINPGKEVPEAVGADDLVADLATVRHLLENPPPAALHQPWDVAALVAAAALEAFLEDGIDVPDETLRLAAEIILTIGDASPRRNEFEEMLYEYGADRSAARVIPLVLLPIASQLRALCDEDGGSTTFDRAASGAMNLAKSSSYEVPLYLARGLDRLWRVPCAEYGRCHHELGWQIATETMRRCVHAPWDPETGQRDILVLNGPLTESLDDATANSIIVPRLDGAIRALAPAAMAATCISARARDLVPILLAAQRRALLEYEHGDPDDRATHALVSARALLTLAENGDDDALFEHIDAFAEDSNLLGKSLSALSAAAEETPARASTARRIWPDVIRHVLSLRDHTRVRSSYYGGTGFADLIPNPVGELPYPYRELDGNPIMWWNPLELRAGVEAWLTPAKGNAECVDRLIGFIGILETEDQVRVGLPWVAAIVLGDPVPIARGAYTLSTWLVEVRPTAVDMELLSAWQEVVDALVVAGDARLAAYSD